MDKQDLNQIKKLVESKLLPNPREYGLKIPLKDLEHLLRRLSYYYYNTDEELVSDRVFDILIEVLEERDPKNKFLKEVGAPISKEAVPLPYPMPSLDKIKPTTNTLDRWLAMYPGPYETSDKLDGVSAELYKGDKLQLFTRGDGIKGQDISHLIKYVLPNSNKIFSKMPPKAAARGELVISKRDFDKHLKDKYKNMRNVVAGVVNSKHYQVEVAKLIRLVSYAVVHPRLKHSEQIDRLLEWGFPIVDNKKYDNLTLDLLSKRLLERREKSTYDIDGIVVIDDSKVYSATSNNPEHGFAFKMVLDDQVAVTTVIEVIWTPSMHGYLKPRLKVEPIELVGVTIVSATAFNAKYVKEHNLGPGAVVKIVRSGDVIPHILEVIKPSKSGKPQMPKVDYKWDATNTNIIVKDVHGAAKDQILTKRITQFFKVLKVKHISEGLVTILVDNGYDSTIKILKVLHDNPSKLAELDRIGVKLVTKIKANVDSALERVTLPELIAASTLIGPGMGVRRVKVITDAYPTLLTVNWDEPTMVEKLVELDGFDTKTASLFASNFSKFKKFYKQLSKMYNLERLQKAPVVKKKAKKNNGRLNGEIVVFTGFRDQVLQKLVEDEGGEVADRVTKNTTLVVYANTDGSKYKKAVELGTKTVSREQFTKKYQ